MSSNTKERIQQQLKNNVVLLYMKGTPQFPMCGFSAQVVGILKELKISFAYVNVLENQDIRSELPKYADWPTFPQFYIKGELIGGCDIVVELHDKGELTALLSKEQVMPLEDAKFIAAE